jgi:hypothetical protein
MCYLVAGFLMYRQCAMGGFREHVEIGRTAHSTKPFRSVLPNLAEFQIPIRHEARVSIRGFPWPDARVGQRPTVRLPLCEIV